MVSGNVEDRFSKIILFFFDLKISIALFENPGAIITSKNKVLIFFAVSPSTGTLLAITDPKADTGSDDSALSHASSSRGYR